MSYFVDIIKPAGYVHWRCFEDVALTYQHSLVEMGLYDVGGRPILFGANLCPQYSIPVEKDAVIVNLEAHSSGWMTDAYLDLLRAHPVLDYSEANVGWLRARGVDAHWCPIRYHPHLTRLTLLPDAERDIDCLFYGGTTERRREIMSTLIGVKGINRVAWIDHSQWEQRDDAIIRAKIVLNLHAYDGSPFEAVRVSYLLSNRCFVISEGPAEAWCKEFVMFQSAKSIATACWLWLRDPGGRAKIAQLGFDEFSAMPQSEVLLTALAAL